MNKHVSGIRLVIALKELWISNRILVYSFPLIILFCFAIYYLWPGGIFYEKWFNPKAFSTKEAWSKALLATYTTQRVFILFIIPIYLVICTKPLLDRLNKSERTNLTPITRLERTLGLTLFVIGITCLGVACFTLYDHVIVAWFNKLYYEEAIRYLEAQGDLYPNISRQTVLFPIQINILGIAFMMILLLLPLYFLSLVFFRKNSVILFLGLLVIIMITLAFFLRWLFAHETSHISIPIQGVFPLTLTILLLASYWYLAMATFYHKLKEKEI
ncbi:hypothetical protein [Sphingobacterium haloxyli]|uniref:Uncharacterized protein n=1 Tax=Sphingobacterium haloxyli TaxID=2100533 RepID=A0A2S9J3J8_9SPHI|nr:hypothetical protein [Sphingobacterium haloxyli]PRD47320.1 hypothetical protein C5745_10885 [Sphingobacterium haloxyli]